MQISPMAVVSSYSAIFGLSTFVDHTNLLSILLYYSMNNGYIFNITSSRLAKGVGAIFDKATLFFFSIWLLNCRLCFSFVGFKLLVIKKNN